MPVVKDRNGKPMVDIRIGPDGAVYIVGVENKSKGTDADKQKKEKEKDS